jgi:hypothetical protein
MTDILPGAKYDRQMPLLLGHCVPFSRLGGRHIAKSSVSLPKLISLVIVPQNHTNLMMVAAATKHPNLNKV